MREIVTTAQAPAAVGPYSQAVKVTCGQLVFCSGQIPLDPESGAIIDGTIADQCRQVMSNLEAVLREAGADFSKVVKTTLFLRDIADFAAVNEVYATYFPTAPPARAALGVDSLPMNARLMIDAIAVL